MSYLERYCRQCRRLVAAAFLDHACPRCGRLTSVVWPAPTLDLTDLSSIGKSAALTPSAEGFPERWLGRRIGLYDIESLLGKGGMAWVFLAKHITLHRHCAIKVLCPELLGRKANSLDLFMAEM